MPTKELEELHKELQVEFSHLKELIQILSRLLQKERREAKERSIDKTSRSNFFNSGILGRSSFLGTYPSTSWRKGLGGLSKSQEEHEELLYLNRVFHKYPAIIWSSLFLNSYSVLEYALYSFSQALRNHNKNLLKLEDLKHKGLTLYRVYFTKVIQIDLKFGDDEDWDYLQEFNTLRNIIIHQNGYAKNKEKYLKKLQNLGLRIDHNGFVTLNDKFNKASVEIIENFINKLFQVISDDF